MDLKIVFYWSGKLPRIAELSVASALSKFPSAQVELWLDTDPGFESEFPTTLNWLKNNKRFSISWFSMRNLVAQSGFPPLGIASSALERIQNIAFQTFHRSPLRKHPWITARGDSPVLRPFLGHHNSIYGWFRAGYPAKTIEWAGAIYRDDLFKILIERVYPDSSVLCADLDVYFAAPEKDWPLDGSFTSRWGDEKWANNPVTFYSSHRNGLSEKMFVDLSSGLPARPWHFFSDENCRKYGIAILDCNRFDPGWNPKSISYARADLFFSKSDDTQLFLKEIRESSLSVHWHNQWQTTPHPSSAYQLLLDESKMALAFRNTPE